MALEALVAVGLASNIVQFVHFTCTLLDTAKEVYQSATGLSEEYLDLWKISIQIKNLSSQLELRSNEAPELTALAARCRAVAEELLDAISSVNIKEFQKSHRSTNGPIKVLTKDTTYSALRESDEEQDMDNVSMNRDQGNATAFDKQTTSKWKSFRSALKIVWKKDRIEGLQKRLAQLREEMSLHILSATSNRQTCIFNMLEASREANIRNHYELTDEIRQQSLNICAVKDSLSKLHSDQQWGKLARHFTEVSDRADSLSRDHTILKSLLFKSIAVRHATIIVAHQRTFEWIFKSSQLPEDDPRSKIEYLNWLRKGQGIYWITGKPGAGKSTLMKYLDDHVNTTLALEEWATSSGHKLVKASYYFWNAGTSMQKSIQGLLQSLLYRILEACPDLASIICEGKFSRKHAAQSSTPWSVQELRTALEAVWDQSSSASKFYLHIDGLDEFDGDHYEVIDTLMRVSKSSRVKICVSSRPWNCFQDAFGGGNVLRLHDLTRQDIVQFTQDSIRSYLLRLTDNPYESYYGELIQEIANRAQGVFLWVRLVVRSLQDGFVNSDPISLIKKRFDSLPTDLEEFFEHMLNSIDKIYQETMAMTFLVAITSEEPLSIIHYSFLDDDDPDCAYQVHFEPFNIREMHSRIQRTHRRLNGRYKGLLEPCAHLSLPSAQSPQDYQPVDFLHRTLRDFLATPRMHASLLSRVHRDFDAYKRISELLLAEAKFTNRIFKPDNFARLLQFSSAVPVTARERATLEFDLVNHVEVVCMQHDPMTENFMIIAAILMGRIDYIDYIFKTQKPIRDLPDLLLRALVCTRNPSATFARYLDCTEPTRPQHEAENPLDDLPFPRLVKLLIDNGAFCNPKTDGLTAWRLFLEKHIAAVADWRLSQQVKDVFVLLVEHGADLQGQSDIWLTILELENTHPSSVEDVIFIFQILLDHGLDPNMRVGGEEDGHMTLWEHFLGFVEDGLSLCGFNQHITNGNCDLIRLFLQNRADPSVKKLHRLIGWGKSSDLFAAREAKKLRKALRKALDRSDPRAHGPNRENTIASKRAWRQDLELERGNRENKRCRKSR